MRTRLAALACAAGLLAAACSSAQPKAATAAASLPPRSAPQFGAELLTPANLPAGWSLAVATP